MLNLQKAKKLLCIIYAWHLFSIFGIIGTLLLGSDIIKGPNPIEIPLVNPKGELQGIATESDKAIAEREKIYFWMRIGLGLVVFDIVIHLPPIANWIKKWDS